MRSGGRLAATAAAAVVCLATNEPSPVALLQQQQQPLHHSAAPLLPSVSQQQHQQQAPVPSESFPSAGYGPVVPHPLYKQSSSAAPPPKNHPSAAAQYHFLPKQHDESLPSAPGGFSQAAPAPPLFPKYAPVIVTTHRLPAGAPAALWYWIVSFVLVVFAGCASGLTVGLMGLDPIQLQVLSTQGTSDERAGVNAVMSVIRNHHLLLVTLLLANSVAMEALPIFLDRLVAPWAAVLLSVTAILLFGEIIPQALCTGPWQLQIAQKSAPFVRGLIAVLFVIAWPIAKLLDFVLGSSEPHSYYARAHLKALIRLHERKPAASETACSALGADEVVVIEGALDMAGKTLREIMLPMEQVFMLEADTPMDSNTLETILKAGHSRIPVYAGRRNNLKGIILTKTLITVDHKQGLKAGQLTVQRRPIFAKPETNLYDLLNEFQKGHTHFAFVTDFPEVFNRAFKERSDIPESAELLGIATLEDVIEELIQEEIYDEFDAKGVSRDPNLAAAAATRSMRDEPPTASFPLCSYQGSDQKTAAVVVPPSSSSLHELPPILQAAAAQRAAAGGDGNHGLALPLLAHGTHYASTGPSVVHPPRTVGSAFSEINPRQQQQQHTTTSRRPAANYPPAASHPPVAGGGTGCPFLQTKDAAAAATAAKRATSRSRTVWARPCGGGGAAAGGPLPLVPPPLYSQESFKSEYASGAVPSRHRLHQLRSRRTGSLDAGKHRQHLVGGVASSSSTFDGEDTAAAS